MFIIRLMRALRGYVRFKATGVFLERFLNMAVHRSINIWDVERHETTLTACTDVKAYKRLRPYAKKTGVRLRVCERHGMPFKLHRYNKRVGLLVGVLFFLGFLCAMGQFVWKIEIQGNTTVAGDEITSAISALGLKPGAFKAGLNVREMERAALLSLQKLSWIAINIDGSTATVEVRERVMPPEMFPDNDRACNIVAERDGLITYMEVYEGQAMRRVGDAVKAGDVIISGIIEDKKLQATYKHARGKIMAQTETELTVEQPLIISEKKFTGTQKHRRYLRVFGADMPLFIYRPFKVAYELEREVKKVHIGAINLPLSVIDERYDFYVEEQREVTREEAASLAQKTLSEQEKTEFLGAKIIEKKESFTITGDIYKLKVKYLCNIDIAKEQEILKNE